MAAPFEVLKIDPATARSPRSLAAKYRDLRLHALQQSPDSFSSTYEEESTYSLETWQSRLFRPGKTTFVCIDKSSSAPSDAVEEGQWAGQISVLGPIPADTYRLPIESGQPAVVDDSEEERWQVSGLFTLPTYRGKGLAKMLCKAAFESLGSPQGKTTRIRLMAKPQNVVTLRLCGSMGFEDAGRCTLEEALRANLEEEQIPKEMPLPEKFTSRSGIIMEMRTKA